MKSYERVTIQILTWSDEDIVRTSTTPFSEQVGDNEVPFEGGWNSK